MATKVHENSSFYEFNKCLEIIKTLLESEVHKNLKI